MHPSNTKSCAFLGVVLLVQLAVSSEAFLVGRSSHDQRTTRTTRLHDTTEEQTNARRELERTASHLEKLSRRTTEATSGDEERQVLYQSLIQKSANSLKVDLKELGLPRNGRKPDLVNRLVDAELQRRHGNVLPDLLSGSDIIEEQANEFAAAIGNQQQQQRVPTFCGLTLSEAAGRALGSAEFQDASSIQKASIPLLSSGESAILHSETGSGKTLAYLLSITEQLWREKDEYEELGYCLILLPTRELAAQVAGIAQVLAPPDSVRLVFRATNLLSDSPKERGEESMGGIVHQSTSRKSPRLFVGSAKAIMTSLYGNEKMTAPPTSKPEAMHFLRNVRWLVMDEVDRLLHVKKAKGEGKRYKQHEKPAAVVASAIARMTLGRAQVICASATVGRPLRRELSRVLGLTMEECPATIRGLQNDDDDNSLPSSAEATSTTSRAVTIPDLVQHYILPEEGDSTGRLLTSAFCAIDKLAKKKPRKMLLVLTRGCDMSTKNAIGALSHFRCRPEPISLLDALEADGSDSMIEIHRQVTGAVGIGETGYFQKASDKHDAEEEDEEASKMEYLLVTGEDTIRGLHLDGLDVVLVIGRPTNPDEYCHIAGRTGRAGKDGKVINIVSEKGAAYLQSWQKMLELDFQTTSIDDMEAL